MSKPVVLACWDFTRLDLMDWYFLLKPRYRVLFLANRGRDYGVEPEPVEKIFWEDYPDANRLIENFEPVLGLFHYISCAATLTLNSALKNRSIATVFLQHGVTSSLALELEESRNSVRSRKLAGANRWSLRYALGSFFSEPLPDFLKLLAFLVIRRKKDLEDAKLVVAPRALFPSHFILRSPQTARLYLESGTGDANLHFIGDPGWDQFFSSNHLAAKQEKEEILFIDQPVWKPSAIHPGYGPQFLERALTTLNEACARRGMTLVVKLHPHSQDTDLYPELSHTRYLKEGNLPELLHQCRGVVGLNSSVMMPAVFLKPCFLLRIPGCGLQQSLLEAGLAEGQLLSEFSAEQALDFLTRPKKPPSSHLVKQFLHSTDGDARSRLDTLLHSLCKNPKTEGAP